MRVEVEGGALLLASTRLSSRAAQVRSQVTACDGLSNGLRDPALRVAGRALADTTSDVLELVATDLELLARHVRDGAGLYDRVEHRARAAMGAQ